MSKRLRYYFAGFGIGILIGLLVSYLIGTRNFLWTSNCGNLCGILALAWAQHRGLAPTPEEVNRPLSLFTPVERHGQEPKR
jgi:hypothetical protein